MPITLIKELIEGEYRIIALSPQLRDDIEELVLEDFDSLQAAAAGERQRIELKWIELNAQRQKLLDAHYAVPLNLLKTEQDRIGGQLMRIREGLAEADANYEQARRTPADTLNLTQDCDAAYLEANDSTRRLFNQAFFAKIYIDEDDKTREQTVRVDYNEPFDSLLSRLIPARVHHTLDIKKTAHPDTSEGGPETSFEGTAKVQGSHTDTLVVLARLFSNSTPSTLTRALHAYHNANGTQSAFGHAFRALPKRAKVLTPGQTEVVSR
jgi:hypothetical protein